jgi:hypothetical protein
MKETLEKRIRRIALVMLLAGLAGLGMSALGLFRNPTQFFFSYLFAVLFWMGLSLGCFAIVMIHQVTGGRWGYPTRRFLESGFMGLPLMLALFIPIFVGLAHLYPWARPGEVMAEKALQHRHQYQNQWGYIGRQVIFLLVWIGLAVRLRKLSLEQDRTQDAEPTRKARALSGPGLVIYGLLGTFAVVDWLMSLETHWYSSLFAVIVLSGQILTAFAFSVVMLTLFRKQAPFAEVVSKVHYHHLGNLLLTFVLFWTYVSFGQLLIMYSGDLPHEIDWYRHRIAGNWQLVVVAIAAFHFFVPFFLLLFRAIKKHTAALTALAAMLFAMHMVQTYWLIMPALHQRGVSLSWLDFTAQIGVGGLWLSLFLHRLKAAPLLPQNDPGMQFAFVYAKS